MIIGVTGSFCSGKSLVSRIFQGYGAKVIDLDILAHKCLKIGTPTATKIVKEFGEDIVQGGEVDRKRLASLVFKSKVRIKKLNSVIHPQVIRQMLKLIEKNQDKYRMIVVEAPLLFEAGLKKHFDYIIAVKADRAAQIERAASKRKMDRGQVLRRISYQMPLAEKIKKADFIIDNNGSVGAVKIQVEKIIQRLGHN